jgi:transposase
VGSRIYRESLLNRKRRKYSQISARHNAPAENPVEGIWLQVKNFIRRFYHICTNFSIVKRLFEFFFDFKLFNNPNLKKYDAFAQLI